MAAPIVYKWTDGNAPVARGESRSLHDILYACLVTGYGDKPAAGWTREYVNASFDRAAFRNNPVTGTGMYFQVDAPSGTAIIPKVQGFETMTSEASGLFPFYASQQSVNVSAATGTTARPWILIADDRAFYLLIWASLTSTPSKTQGDAMGVFFGDIVKYHPSDAYNCALSVGVANRTPFCHMVVSSSTSGATLTQGYCFPRRETGATGSIIANSICGGGPGSTGNMGAFGIPYVPGAAIITRPFINIAGAYTLRGWPPGLYYPCHDTPFNQWETVNLDKSYLSLIVNSAQGDMCNMLISLEDWRA